jgi:hypothetical protein
MICFSVSPPFYSKRLLASTGLLFFDRLLDKKRQKKDPAAESQSFVFEILKVGT